MKQYTEAQVALKVVASNLALLSAPTYEALVLDKVKSYLMQQGLAVCKGATPEEAADGIIAFIESLKRPT